MKNNSFRVSPMSKNDIRKKVKSFCDYGVTSNNIVNFVEKLYIWDKEYYFMLKPIEEMPESYAETIPDEKTIIIREDIYYGAKNGNKRDIFTFAHELGHYILHSNALTINLLKMNRSYKDIKKYEDSEWQANYFASCLLVPREYPDIENFSISEIEEHFNVSYTAAKIAYDDIQKMKKKS